MPQSVIPFPQTFKYFVVANFVILGVVWVLFVSLSDSLRRPRWWNITAKHLNTVTLGGMAQNVSIPECRSIFVRKKTRNNSAGEPDGIELPTHSV
jgi:hypothetical protein